MEDEIVKKTQDTLGKIITKPPLADKLLKKPPFRFLHDIFTEIIRTTGFFKGLFNSREMDSKNVTSKEDKISFLQKVIDCVSMVTGVRLSTKPSKIVTGHEPEKTNELLQAIARCIRKNLSSDEAVQLITTKRSGNQNKPPSGSSKKKEGKENRDHDEDPRKKKTDKDGERDRDRSSDKRRRSVGKDRDKESGRDQGAGEGTEEKGRSSRQRSADKSSERTEKKERRKEDAGSKENEEQKPVDSTRRRTKKEDNMIPSSEDQEGKGEEDADSNVERSSRPPRPASAKGHRRRPTGNKSSDSPAQEGEAKGSPAAREPSSKSKPARPPSARPAAPRVRQRRDVADEEIARMESASHQRTAPIIVDRGSKDGDRSSTEDEDEQFLVHEEVQPPEMETLSPLPNGENKEEETEENGQHGGLVKKILETKKELETSAAKGHAAGRKRTEIERSPVIDVQRRKERELVRRDIEKLRDSVQTLCRSAVPLGKIIDYIQEDMDSMQNELLQWRKENKEHALRLKEEDSITKKTVEPLQADLDELNQSIASQLDMIAASKCNVIRNQEKIEKMVAGVTARS